jgi:hypothetical protein
MQHRSFRLSSTAPVTLRERVSFSAIALFGVLFMCLCLANATSIFWMIVPLCAIPVVSGPRAYRIMAAVCLILLFGRAAMQREIEQRRIGIVYHDAFSR